MIRFIYKTRRNQMNFTVLNKVLNLEMKVATFIIQNIKYNKRNVDKERSF